MTRFKLLSNDYKPKKAYVKSLNFDKFYLLQYHTEFDS
jgi:hypothetical protein